MARLLARAAAGLLLLAAPGAALARPSLKARAAFEPIHLSDAAAVVVLVENDGEAGPAILRAERDLGAFLPDSARALVSVEMALDLQPGARKAVTLVLPPSPLSRVRVSLLRGEAVVALDAVELRWAMDERPLIAALEPAPPTLVAAAHRALACEIAEVPSLPASERAWPLLDAVAWDRPRTDALARGVAEAVRAHVVAGGRLVVGVGPEEIDRLERAGLADLLPARAERTEGLGVRLVDADPCSASLHVEDALVVRRGLGAVVLVPHPLDDVAEASWTHLLAVPEASARPEARGRGQASPRWSHLGFANVRDVIPLLVPKPPWVASCTLLVLFLVAAVPLDGWLTRRSLRRGRRSRLGILRYPALAVAATLASLAVADRASGGDMRTWRVDVVDVGPDGRGVGRTTVYAARGRAGRMAVEVEDGALLSARRAFDWGYSDTLPGRLRAHADDTLPSSSGEFETSPWDPVRIRTHWTPSRVPVVRRSDACVPYVLEEAADGAAAVTCSGNIVTPRRVGPGALGQAGDGPADAEIADVLDLAGDLGGSGMVSLVLARRGRLGPPLELDGRSTDAGPTFTLVRYRFASCEGLP